MHLRALLTRTNIFGNYILMISALYSLPIHACEQPTIIFPGQHDEIASNRPVISWLPVDAAVSYDLSIQSRVPEGEVTAQFITTTTDTKFVSPAALSRERAIVSAKVTARCAARVSPTSDRVFFINVSAACPLAVGISTTPMGQFNRISWEPNPQFEAVEVRAFGKKSIGPLERVARAQNFAILQASADPTSVVGVRGICKETDGQWQWLGQSKP
jgi:hypothetical protein